MRRSLFSRGSQVLGVSTVIAQNKDSDGPIFKGQDTPGRREGKTGVTPVKLFDRFAF